MKESRKGENLELEDEPTKLRLLIEKTRDGFEFNGHPFKTEEEAKAFVEAYAASSIIRHGLSAQRPAREDP